MVSGKPSDFKANPPPKEGQGQTPSRSTADKGGRDTAYRSEFATSLEIGSGYILGRTFDYKSVQYAVVDGMAIFEGDIVLSTVQGMKEIADAVRDMPHRPADALSGKPAYAVIISGDRYRWPGGIVHYDIHPSLPNPGRITDAIRHWEERTSIQFIRLDNSNRGTVQNYLYFEDYENEGYCWSYVGMQGGKQTVSLGPYCKTGSTIHELGHAMGLWHEQSREDRDQHITIHKENIISGMEHNFDQHIRDGDDVGPYDYDSIMHYPRDAFSKNGQDTIVPKVDRPIGQREGLSEEDIAAINYMYPTPEPLPNVSIWTAVQFTGTVPAKQKHEWYTHEWPVQWNVIWNIVPKTVLSGSPQIEWKVKVAREVPDYLSYWIEVTNNADSPVEFEARYTVVLGSE